jgi:antitoxin Phd
MLVRKDAMSARIGWLKQLPGWKLEDAKARLSELVRLAKEQGPQRVTVYGRDAVVVISIEDYARVAPVREQPSLHALLSGSPLRDLDVSPAQERSPVREVDL